MIIVLEGSDGTGKTTLARELQLRLNAHYIHLTYRWPDKMEKYHTAAILHAIDIIEKTHRPVIIDRWWMSEAVYAEVYRKGTPWPEMGRMLDRLLIRHGGLYITCLVNYMDAYREHFERLKQERYEMYENTMDVAMAYNNLYHGGQVNNTKTGGYFQQLMRKGLKHRLDVMKYSIEVEGANMREYIDRVEQRLMLLNCLQHEYLNTGRTIQNALGSVFRSDILFIGELCNPKGRMAIRMPFFEHANCSLYLSQVLSKIGFDEDRGMWTNLFEPDSRRVIFKWLHCNKCKEKQVIVFGENAAAEFEYHYSDVKFHKVVHPQTARRFPHFGAQFEVQLREILGEGRLNAS